MTPPVRTVHVDAARLDRWVAGFAGRHGSVELREEPEAVTVLARDGSEAVLHVAFPPLPPETSSGVALGGVARLAEHARSPRRVLVLLVRRGGYACAVVEASRVTRSKVGSRYVQGRTAAGGWSQQRFARRREGQARALVKDAADVAVRVLAPVPAAAVGPAGQGPEVLVTGGDRALVDQVLADPRLAALRRLSRGPHLEVGDPRADAVRALPERLRAVAITLREADPGAPRSAGTPK